jgi:hypothetical protein
MGVQSGTRGGVKPRELDFLQQLEPISHSKKIGSLTGTVVNHDILPHTF